MSPLTIKTFSFVRISYDKYWESIYRDLISIEVRELLQANDLDIDQKDGLPFSDEAIQLPTMWFTNILFTTLMSKNNKLP